MSGTGNVSSKVISCASEQCGKDKPDRKRLACDRSPRGGVVNLEQHELRVGLR